MALNLKMFKTLGTMTVVTPPSMVNPDHIGFTIINFREKEKNHFAKELNKLFPNDNITIFIYDHPGYQDWLEQAMSKSNYIIMDKILLELTKQRLLEAIKLKLHLYVLVQK